MAKVYRYRFFDKYPIVGKVADAQLIELGDLTGLVPGDPDVDTTCVVEPGINFWDTDLATSQAAFALAFLGTAQQTAPTDGIQRIRIAVDGVFEYACAELGAGYGLCIGDLVGIDGNDEDPVDGLLSQRVVEVATCDLAIGRVWKDAPAGSESVLVRIMPLIRSTCNWFELSQGGPQV